MRDKLPWVVQVEWTVHTHLLLAGKIIVGCTFTEDL